jgi:hypothetical protein
MWTSKATLNFAFERSNVSRFDYILRDTHQIGGERCGIAALRYVIVVMDPGKF